MVSIRIILADDHQIVRDGIRLVVAREPDLEVVAEGENGREVVRLTRELAPDVVIMDITMPDLNGIEATRQIKAEAPQVRIIALSMHSDRRYVTRMLEAGASGYLLKECAIDEVVRAVRAVAGGQAYLSPGIAGTIITELKSRGGHGAEPGQGPELSDREREVLQLLAEGCTSKEIAERLFVSVKTVDAHRRQIMDKLGLRTVAELTKYAVREGLTSLE